MMHLVWNHSQLYREDDSIALLNEMENYEDDEEYHLYHNRRIRHNLSSFDRIDITLHFEIFRIMICEILSFVLCHDYQESLFWIHPVFLQIEKW